MKRQISFKKLNIILVVILIGALSIIGLTVTNLKNNSNSNQNAFAAITATIQPTIWAKETIPPTPPIATPTVQMTISAPTATPAIGEIINIPSAVRGDLTVRRTDIAPLISQQEAQQVLKDYGIIWAFEDTQSIPSVTLLATYGLVTQGRPTPDGKDWIGNRNIRLSNGTILPYIENRPMWILDYGNVAVQGSMKTFNHLACLVDAETKTLIVGWMYDGE
jgi:hypothetical protein